MIGQIEDLLGQLDALLERGIAELDPINTSSALDEWDKRYL